MCIFTQCTSTLGPLAEITHLQLQSTARLINISKLWIGRSSFRGIGAEDARNILQEISIHAECDHWLREQSLNGDALVTITAADEQTCYNSCLQTVECEAVTYEPGTLECKMKEAPSYRLTYRWTAINSIRVCNVLRVRSLSQSQQVRSRLH